MSRVKRYLEDLAEPLLAEIHRSGSAVIVPELEEERDSWSYPERVWRRTLAVMEERWLSGPSRESRQRLAELEAELAEWQCPAPADLRQDYREALEQCVSEALKGPEELLEAYGVALDWLDAGLCAVPLDPEWAVAHSEGVWANYGGGEQ